MNNRKYISLKIISLFAFCLGIAHQQNLAATHFKSVCKLSRRQITSVRYDMSRRLPMLQNVAIPNYARRSIVHCRPAQNHYTNPKNNRFWGYTTMGIGVVTIGLYEAKYKGDTIFVDGEPYYLYQQLAATTAGLTAVSVTCPPAGAVIGVGAIIVGGLLVITAVDENSRRSRSQTQSQPQIQKYVPPPRTLSPYWQGRGLERAKPKGGKKRWKDPKKRLYEWDYDHGEIEEFDKTGKNHKGGYDAEDGHQTRPADPSRSIEP